MPLRPYTPHDSLALATITAACNLTDPLARYCRHINRDEYQHQQTADHNNGDDDRQWKAHIKSLRKSFEFEMLLPGTVCWVVYVHDHNQSVDDANDEGIGGGEKVVGFAIWNRHGDSETAQKWRVEGSKVSTRIKSMMSYITMTLTYPFDTSINHTHMTNFQRRVRTAPSPLPSGQKLKLPRERWELEALYIAPDYQRRGYGMEALKWGLDVAREEGVDVWVWSSDSGKKVYEKGGFEAVGRIGFGDLLSDATLTNKNNDDSVGDGDGDGDGEVAVWVMVWRARDHES
ncbi:hypothetical protein EYB25_009675 [Talaromyces marneffei]|uniref:uncharacterized protein n=1 Tax=Talaromyces marneffei TaxID=37727 RepID=UPI0012A94AAF|nr:uncharacterized protein EYB26_008944 [Talaromyces marneffei]KAE8547882.1 hypothetical protein EYB25_009675 [Talaromyces marneffei]QGA21234.1 hypothetical protein EYB26_008944 [Talaromyces marneffei]